MSQVVAILRDVRQRLDDPRHWLKGSWCGYIDAYGRRWHRVPEDKLANCWCLGGAISVSIANLTPGPVTATELRSEVERELLETLELPLAAVYMFNDLAHTSHADVIELLDKTLARLTPEAA